MTDKKSDDEIIKGLECCNKVGRGYCKSCPFFSNHKCSYILISNTLDLINRQKAESDCAKAKIKICAEVIDRQDKEIERLKGWEDVLKAKEHSLIKYTAYKEFADKLRKKAIHSQYIGDVIPVSVVDHILKEMVGKK